jgi:hypothetical protein
MGFNPLKIPYIKIAHDKGLGIGDLNNIEVVGDSIQGINFNFKVGRSLHKFLGWLAWYGPTNFLQKLIFRTPLVILPILISEINHDYIHWPLKEKWIYKKWKKYTPWGQLFQKYEKEKIINKP